MFKLHNNVKKKNLTGLEIVTDTPDSNKAIRPIPFIYYLFHITVLPLAKLSQFYADFKIVIHLKLH